MNKQTPYAALSRTTCQTKATDYYIRFPSCCAKLFEGAKRCYVLKTDGNSYIVIQPIWKHENNEKPWTHALFQEKKGHCTRISVTGKVRNGYLPVRFFDGSHYKIKRRSSNGSVYICLDEPIKEESVTEKDKLIQDLRQQVAALEEENTRMRQQIGAYVCEFRICRFCSNLHADCSPTDGSCVPMWRGL